MFLLLCENSISSLSNRTNKLNLIYSFLQISIFITLRISVSNCTSHLDCSLHGENGPETLLTFETEITRDVFINLH